MNHDNGAGLARGWQGADTGKSGFATGASLAVAIDVGLNFAVNRVAVLQCLLGLRDSDRAVRCIGNDFAGVHFAETEDFHTRAGEAPGHAEIR